MPRGSRLDDAVVFALFLAVPLAAAPVFWDQFTTVKWYVLEALGAAWFLAELWACGSAGWPGFLRRRRWAGLALAILVLGSSLRNGIGWAAPALLDRLSFVLLVLASFWYFRRNEGSTRWIVLATGVATGLVVVVGLAQVVGWRPLPALSAGDQRSAFFGNVNMAAQFLGFSAVLLMAKGPAAAESRVLEGLREALLALAFTYLCFLSCRSVLLALLVAVVPLAVRRQLALKAAARTLGAATLAILILLRLGSAPGSPPAFLSGLGLTPEKAASTSMRLDVWKATLALIRDHPLGVGSGNFGDAFIPYQLGLRAIQGGTVLFCTPHNEYLRSLAEEGAVFTALAGALLLLLIRDLIGARETELGISDRTALLVAGGAFFAVEAFFQFPFGTAYGCLMAAVLLGLALATVEPPVLDGGAPPTDRRPSASWRALGTIAAVVTFALLACVVTSEWLFVNRNRELRAQDLACRLDPRDLPACVTAAWLHARNGEVHQARAGLVHVLQDSPYYYPAIRMLGEIAAADGDRRGSCLYLWTYDQLFRGGSSVHSRLGTLCEGTPPAGLPAALMPYYGKMPLAERDGVRQPE